MPATVYLQIFVLRLKECCAARHQNLFHKSQKEKRTSCSRRLQSSWRSSLTTTISTLPQVLRSYMQHHHHHHSAKKMLRLHLIILRISVSQGNRGELVLKRFGTLFAK